MALLNINGVDMPMPTKYEPTLSDLDSADSTRNESGVLFRNRIRAAVVKISVGYIVTGSVVATILSAISDDKVTVTYLDPKTYSHQQAEMYVSDRSCTMKKYLEGDAPADILWEVSFSLVQY